MFFLYVTSVLPNNFNFVITIVFDLIQRPTLLSHSSNDDSN